MKYPISILTKLLLGAALALVLSSCATRPAPDFGGRWKNINRFSEETQAIPLHEFLALRMMVRMNDSENI